MIGEKMKGLILVLLFALIVPDAKSAQAELPAGVNELVLGFVINNCSYLESAEAPLEEFVIRSFNITSIEGQADSVFEVNLDMNLVYGNDDYTMEETQQLTLDNSSGRFEIKKALGPCQFH